MCVYVCVCWREYLDNTYKVILSETMTIKWHREASLKPLRACAAEHVADRVCWTCTQQTNRGWSERSPASHSLRPSLPHLSGWQKYWLLIIQEAAVSMCQKGTSVTSICRFDGLIWCNKKPERCCPLAFVAFVLAWILKLMGRSGQRIKVKQFDLYFKGCDYSGVRLTDSRK